MRCHVKFNATLRPQLAGSLPQPCPFIIACPLAESRTLFFLSQYSYYISLFFPSFSLSLVCRFFFLLFLRLAFSTFAPQCSPSGELVDCRHDFHPRPVVVVQPRPLLRPFSPPSTPSFFSPHAACSNPAPLSSTFFRDDGGLCYSRNTHAPRHSHQKLGRRQFPNFSIADAHKSMYSRGE